MAGAVHTVLQPPQWLASLVRSTQLPPQRIVVPPHPELHAYTPPESEQTGVAPPQIMVHAPQWPGCERSASHPSDGSPLQSAKPARQLNPQAVPLHVAVALAGVVHAVQLETPHEETDVFGTHTPRHR